MEDFKSFDPSRLVAASDPLGSEPSPVDRPDNFMCGVASELVQMSRATELAMNEADWNEALTALHKVISSAVELHTYIRSKGGFVVQGNSYANVEDLVRLLE